MAMALRSNPTWYDCLFCSDDYSTSICLPSLKILYKIEKNDTFPFGDAISCIYPVMERILNYLPYEDLENIIKLENRNWRDSAICTLKKRHNVCWFSLHEQNHRLLLKNSANVNFESRNFLFLAYNCNKLKRLQMNICIHNEEESTDKKTFMEYIEDNIIKWDAMNCCILASDYLYPLFQIKNETINSWFSAITIPEIDNVRIAATSSIPDSPRDDFYLSKNENYICLLIFSIGNPHCAIRKFICDILDGYSSKDIALIGGVANRVMTDVCCNELYGNNLSFLCVGFIEYEKSTCTAYSLVLTEKEDFESQLSKFKEDIVLRKNSMLIRLTTDRGKAFHDDAILRKHFPNVPILGMESFGQCGWNKFPKNESCIVFDISKFEDTFPLSYRSHTTALMLLTWEY